MRHTQQQHSELTIHTHTHTRLHTAKHSRTPSIQSKDTALRQLRPIGNGSGKRLDVASRERQLRKSKWPTFVSSSNSAPQNSSIWADTSCLHFLSVSYLVHFPRSRWSSRMCGGLPVYPLTVESLQQYFSDFVFSARRNCLKFTKKMNGNESIAIWKWMLKEAKIFLRNCKSLS